VTDQGHIVQGAVLEQCGNVGNVRLEIDIGAQQMSPLAKPGQRRRNHPVTVGAKIGGDVLPAPAAKPCTGNKQKRRHSEAESRAKLALKRASS
jgi:hypothetical protein